MNIPWYAYFRMDGSEGNLFWTEDPPPLTTDEEVTESKLEGSEEVLSGISKYYVK